MAETTFNKPISTHFAPVNITDSVTLSSSITYYDGGILKSGNMVYVTLRFDVKTAIPSRGAIITKGMPPARYAYGNIFDVKPTASYVGPNPKHALTNNGADVGVLRLYDNSTEGLSAGTRYYVSGCYICE